MKRKLLSIILAFVFIVGLLPITVSADHVPTFIEYKDADTSESVMTLFKTDKEAFVIEQPDETLITVDADYSDWGFSVFLDNGVMTQIGKHKLVSYPMPDGYEAVEIYCHVYDDNGKRVEEYGGFTVYERELQGFRTDITIFVRKTDSATITAVPSPSTVIVNGNDVAFDAYNINGSNYFKLRDLAMAFNGSTKSFEITWDEGKNAINIISYTEYTTVGGELATGNGKIDSISATSSKIYLDGKEISLTAYNINGNNYFKLRDLMQALDIYVGWDDATKTITLDTSKGYAAD